MSFASYGLGTIRSALYLDTQQYKQALMQATGMTQKAVARNNKILALQAGSANVGMSAAIGATMIAPMVAVISRIEKVYGDYERVLAKIRTVSNSTAQEMKVLNNQFIGQGKAFGESPTNMAKAGYVAAQAMFTSFREMKKITQSSAQLRLASGGEITTEASAESLTRMMQAFGMGVEKLDEINDVMIRTRDVGAVSMDKIADSVRNVAAAYAQAFPKDKMKAFKEMMSLIASGTLGGMKEDVMATGIRGILARIFHESEKPKSALNALAVSKGYQNAAQMLQGGLIPFLRQVSDATGGYLELLSALNFERREISAVASVIRGLMGKTEETSRYISDSSGAIRENVERMKGTWWYAKESMKAAKESVWLSFGPVAIKHLTSLAEHIQKVFGYFEKLPESTKEVILLAGAFSALRVAISAIGGALQILGVRWTTIIPGLSTLLSIFGNGGGKRAGFNSVAKGLNWGAMGLLATPTLSPTIASTIVNKKEQAKALKNAMKSGGLGLAMASTDLPDLAAHKTTRVPLPASYYKRMLSSSVKQQRIYEQAMYLWPFIPSRNPFSSASRRTSRIALPRFMNTAMGLTPNRDTSGNAFTNSLMAMYLQLTGLKRSRSASFIQNRPVAGFGWGNITRAFAGSPLTSGRLAGTPMNRTVSGMGMPNFSVGITAMTAMGMQARTKIASLLSSVFTTTTAVISSMTVTLTKSVLMAWSDFSIAFVSMTRSTMKTLKGLLITAGVGGVSTAKKAGMGLEGFMGYFLGGGAKSLLGRGAGSLMRGGIWGMLIALIGSALAGLGFSLKDQIEGFTKIPLLDSVKNAWEKFLVILKKFFGLLIHSFTVGFNALFMLPKLALSKDRKSVLDEFYKQVQESFERTGLAGPKKYKGPAEYFAEVVDKMVKEMSPTGTMEGLSEEDRLAIMREIFTPKHSFRFGNEAEGYTDVKNQALLYEEGKALFKDLFEAPLVVAGIKKQGDNITPPGVPQWKEQVDIKMGELADAMTLGTSEAWKAIVPKYFVEEKTLKNQERQLQLSSEMKTILGDIRLNTENALGSEDTSFNFDGAMDLQGN